MCNRHHMAPVILLKGSRAPFNVVILTVVTCYRLARQIIIRRIDHPPPFQSCTVCYYYNTPPAYFLLPETRTLLDVKFVVSEYYIRI